MINPMVQASPGTVLGTLGCTIILGIKLSGVLQTKPQTGMKCYGHSKVTCAVIKCFSLASYLSHITLSLDCLLCLESPEIPPPVIRLKVQLLFEFQAASWFPDYLDFFLGLRHFTFPGTPSAALDFSYYNSTLVSIILRFSPPLLGLLALFGFCFYTVLFFWDLSPNLPVIDCSVFCSWISDPSWIRFDKSLG